MANFSSKSNKRSISLPSRSHPATQNIEEEINKLKTWEFSASPTAEAVYSGLIGLREVHKCMVDLLNLPLTLHSLSQFQNKKWVDEILDKSVRFLDICSTTKEIVSQFKENVKDVQSSLRRRKEDLSINNYTTFRKKMKKEAKSLITTLKRMDHEEVVDVMEVDDQLVSAVIRVLREVATMGISVYQMLLNYLSASNSKPISKWSLVSRLVNKGVDQGNTVNEIESVDAALSSLSKCGPNEMEKIQFVQSKLERVEAHFECIEKGLDNIFRCLIRSRSTLLNVVSCQ
ncbi:protein BPS1, chloroplastic-like [Solanum verrucosum]|uniref:protein BPS1, chloroplastic-like n=1 Tax=Solanum verrucosum TaxID=315347 RepID=UPI0020D1562F|nr:protein BPS1, chloroplastic-like [Solanum verrucosum]